jgi:hypothetical protein
VERLALLVVAVVLLLPACGDNSGEQASSETTASVPLSAAAGETYERAYSECASTTLDRLAGKYHVQARVPLARAVGEAWAEQVGGGADAARAGEAGCRDALQSRPSPDEGA